MDKLLNFLGLCRRAGKLITGNDITLEAVKNKEAKAVITAADISPNTERKIIQCCENNSVSLIKLNRSKDELSMALGRLTAVAAITDEGFARNIERLNRTEAGGNRV